MGNSIKLPISRFVRVSGLVVLLLMLLALNACSSAGSGDGSASSGSDNSSAGNASSKQLNDYSWEELSAISNEISAASSEDDALATAAKYGFVSDSGSIDEAQIKQVELADGSTTGVQIIGFYHDDKADGTGKAGITFIFTDAVSELAVLNSGAGKSGWKDCIPRRWLIETFESQLPADLDKAIVPVLKKTNNAGFTNDPSSVTTTEDKLWLPSRKEIGKVDTSIAGGSVLDLEGSTYRLFSSNSEQNANSTLVKNYLPATSVNSYVSTGESCSWWLRSPSPASESSWQQVFFDGRYHMPQDPYSYEGIVPAFCI